jgi:cell division protein FtsL
MSPRTAAGALPDPSGPLRRGAEPATVPTRAPERELRVVERTRRGRGWQVGTVAGVLLFLALFAVAGFQALIVTHQKSLDDLTTRISAEEERARALEDDLAELQSPQRITEIAKDRLGMVSPPEVVYLQPRDDDDARAGEVPEPTPPATTPPTTLAASKGGSTGSGSGSSTGNSSGSSGSSAGTRSTTGATGATGATGNGSSNGSTNGRTTAGGTGSAPTGGATR